LKGHGVVMEMTDLESFGRMMTKLRFRQRNQEASADKSNPYMLPGQGTQKLKKREYFYILLCNNIYMHHVHNQ